jgi:hypothetical protein
MQSDILTPFPGKAHITALAKLTSVSLPLTVTLSPGPAFPKADTPAESV